MSDKKKYPKKTWFIYDANGPLFSWSPTGDIKDNFARAEEYLKKNHPKVYQKAVLEKNPKHYAEMVRKNQEGSLSGQLPVYPNKRMLEIAHKIRQHGGRNVVISDGDKKFLNKLIHKISDGSPPFDEEDIKSSMNIGNKKESKTWYSIFQEMGVQEGDRFYGIEDTEANARAMARAAKDSGLVSRVYLIDISLSPDEAKIDGEIIRIGSEKYLESKTQRHLSYIKNKNSSGQRHHILSIFFVTLALLEFL